MTIHNRYFRQELALRSKLIMLLGLLSGFGIDQAYAQEKPDRKFEKASEKAISLYFPGQTVNRTALWPAGSQTGYAEMVTSGPDTLGYLMLSSAMGRYDRFDYLALLSPGIRVIQVGIINYRSDHGYQVASPRWLAQFNGYSADSLWQVGREVDAISGATISATGLCNDLYTAMQRLREQVLIE